MSTTVTENVLPAQLASALAQPFDPRQLKWKPGAVSGNRALALCYVDARTVMDRLDEALGPFGWKDDYEIQADGSVLCRLSIRVSGEWITKVDVGGQSEQPDEGDRCKAAFSDALKRAAVKFGIGRYLYRLPNQWVDYDPQRKQFKSTPKLPGEALPRPHSSQGPPRTGAELLARLAGFEPKLVAEGLCQPDALREYLVREAAKIGLKQPIAEWAPERVAWANGEARRLVEHWRAEKKQAEEARANWHPGGAELDALYTELARVKRAWGFVKARLGLGPGLKEQDLTADLYERVMKALHDEPGRD
jgi:hypothetical protein